MKIGIIGAGIGGLTLGYYLSELNHQLTIFESEKETGGLLRGLSIGGSNIEGYYHHLFTIDNEAISLIKELGLEEKLRYLVGNTGVFYQDNIYPFTTPFDLLKFSPLSFMDRLRCGFLVLILKLISKGEIFRKIIAKDWLKKFMGKKVYQILWQPLLVGKFGDKADKVSMIWLWNRLYRRGRTLLYLSGGFNLMLEKLKEKIEKKGNQILFENKIEQIKTTKDNKIEVTSNKQQYIFDKVIVTTSISRYLEMVKQLPDKEIQELKKIQYRASLCVVLILKQKLMKETYWLNINDLEMPLLSVVEHTNFMKPVDYQNKHIVYVGNYPDINDKIMSFSEQEIKKIITKELKRINANFEESWIEDLFVFKDKEAQSIVTIDYQIPSFLTPIPNLYLMTMAQIYPEDRGINQHIKMAKKIARKIIRNNE